MREETTRSIDACCKIVATLAFVVGGAWTVYTYFNARAAEVRTATIEAKKPFLSRRLQVYVEMVDLASQLANMTEDRKSDVWKNPKGITRAEYEKRKARFEALDLGLLNLVADLQVKIAATGLITCMEDPHQDPEERPCNLMALAHRFADACKASIGNEWQVTLAPDDVTMEKLEELRN